MRLDRPTPSVAFFEGPRGVAARHPSDRLARKIATPFPGSAAEDHLREAREVAGGGKQSAAGNRLARRVVQRTFQVGDRLADEAGLRRVGAMRTREARDLEGGWNECRVAHPERAKEAAAKPGSGPVILLDHCDNCGSGGTQDDMTAIEAVLRAGLEDVAAFGVADPQAVEQLIAIGVGRRGTVALGGKRDMPSIGVKGRPLPVSGVVRAITDGEFVIRGPMYTGVRVAMGRTAVIDTGAVEIVVTERNHEPWDLGCLQSVGIEPRAKRFVLLKSRVHWRAGFKPIAKAVVDLSGQGVTTSDYSILRFDKLRRPIYPLDKMPD